jgi:TonB family protein
MGYQALLFCPDEKTARTLTQVLSELEFSVEPCTETFAAVKKLMGEHFDAVVVDCDNEQNATLLFKSARNSTSNQASLAVAVVEGQVGVAKAFRIGANLVLTKPINVEQAKGTLRVARGLLRKGETGKPAAPIATTPTPPTQRPAAPVARPAAIPAKPPVPARPSPAPAAIPTGFVDAPVQAPSVARKVAASAPLSANLAPAAIPTLPTPAAPAISAEVKPAPKPAASGLPVGSTPPALWAGSGAASAPAPAREAQPSADLGTPFSSTPAENEVHASGTSSGTLEATASASDSAVPSFTFGGANAPEESGGSKRILFGLVAVVLIGAVLYVGRSYLGGHSSPTVNQPAAVSAPGSTQPAPVPSTPAPALALSKPSAQTASPATTSSAAPSDIELVSSGNANATPSSAKESVPSAKSAPAAEPGEAPRVVRGGAVPKLKTQPAAPDAPPPSVIGMDESASSGLPNLGGSTTAPKPVLGRLNISQGVSQGLLVKKVDPIYPPNAVHMRIEGSVQLMATISKTGDITDVKVLSGDQQLTRAASDAVKRWKYKPYLLNGEPVEIQTQVTVNFRLPH